MKYVTIRKRIKSYTQKTHRFRKKTTPAHPQPHETHEHVMLIKSEEKV